MGSPLEDKIHIGEADTSGGGVLQFPKLIFGFVGARDWQSSDRSGVDPWSGSKREILYIGICDCFLGFMHAALKSYTDMHGGVLNRFLMWQFWYLEFHHSHLPLLWQHKILCTIYRAFGFLVVNFCIIVLQLLELYKPRLGMLKVFMYILYNHSKCFI